MKKRIAFVLDYLHIGGIERVLVNLLKSLDYQQMDVDLYLQAAEGEFLREVPENVKKIEYGPESKSVRLKRDIKSCNVRDALFVLYIGWKMRFVKTTVDKFVLCGKLMTNKQFPEYDTVVAFHGGDYWSSYFATHYLRAKRHVTWIHGLIDPIAVPHFFDAFGAVVCVSKGNEQWLNSEYPDTVGKTVVYHNLLDVNDILEKDKADVDDMPSNGTSIVSVGRLSEEKGFLMVPEIARKLTDAGYLFDWYLIGDGPIRDQIEKECQKLSVTNVHLLGAKSNPYPYMKRCTLYVQPSHSEGFCTTTNEAKLFCKPIVVTDVPGMQEQFTHGENGYIVPHDTVDDLVTGITYILDRPDLQRQFADELHNHQDDRLKDVEALQNFLLK